MAAVLAVLLMPSIDRAATAYLDMGAGWIIFGLVVLAPATESFVLIYPTVIATDAVKRHWLACLVGSAPIALVHAFTMLHKPLVVWWAFAWQAHRYTALRAQGVGFWGRYAFVFALHAGSNGILVALLLIARASMAA